MINSGVGSVHEQVSRHGVRGYFDLWLLSRHPHLNKTTLQTATERTFRNGKIEKEATPIGLSAKFGHNPAQQAL
jgi:hypothetical protein